MPTDIKKSNIKSLIDWLLDILFPKFCLSCHQEGFYVCPDCFAKLPIQKHFYCYLCGKRSPNGETCPKCKSKAGSKLTGLLVASDWNNLLVRQIIYEYKYRFITELSSLLTQLLVVFLNQSGFFTQHLPLDINSYILIPVPLHPRRLAWRGFNQAELLANGISNYLKIPVANNLIRRCHHTPPQMDITDKNERIKNVTNAFALNPNFKIGTGNQIKNKIIILVDDISTTGSTLNECAKALKPLKPKEMWGLVLARG